MLFKWFGKFLFQKPLIVLTIQGLTIFRVCGVFTGCFLPGFLPNAGVKNHFLFPPKNTPPTPRTDGKKIFLMHRHHDFSKNAFFAVWEERNGTETLRQIREKLRQIRETLRRIRPPNTIKNGSQGWKGVFPDFGWSAAAAGLKPLAAAHHLWVKESAFFN